MENCKNILQVLFSYRRNIKDLPFVKVLTDNEQAIAITRSISEIFGEDFEFKSLKNLSLTECLKLQENLKITKGLIENKDISAYAKSFSDNNYIYINEQDHIRLEARSNCNLEECYNNLNKLDDILLDKLEVAFDIKYGYLTQNPFLCGTGLEMQAVLFLPAIINANKFEKLLQVVTKEFELFDLNGKKFAGDIPVCIIKNKYTFGYKENEFAKKFQKILENIIKLEESVEAEQFELSASSLVNKIFTSYGILSNAYRLTLNGAINYLSDVVWGINMNILKGKIDILQVVSQISEAHITEDDKKSLKEQEKTRAKLCWTILKSIKKGEVDV